jgi:hypothetical protein
MNHWNDGIAGDRIAEIVITTISSIIVKPRACINVGSVLMPEPSLSRGVRHCPQSPLNGTEPATSGGSALSVARTGDARLELARPSGRIQ